MIAADETDALVLEVIEEIDALEGTERHQALVYWARSEMYHPLMGMFEGRPGIVARQAHKALRLDFDADTPAKRWSEASPFVGKESIDRLLGEEPAPSGKRIARYSTWPFRTMTDSDGNAVIGAAVGCHDPWTMDPYHHLDITDVLEWNPRTGKVKVSGEHCSADCLIMPYVAPDKLTIYKEPLSFFRAWVENRRRTDALLKEKAAGKWVHPVAEPKDGGLPGALAIGRLDRLQWRTLHIREIEAGPGLERSALRNALIASLNLPQITGGNSARG